MSRSTRVSKGLSEPSTSFHSGPPPHNGDPSQHQSLDLTRFALFHGLSKNELETIYPLLQPRFIGAGLTFIQQGCSGTGLFLLHQGTVKVCLSPTDQQKQLSERQQGRAILALCGPGETLGEIDAADGSGHTASVITLEPSHFLWMSVDDFKLCRKRLPQVQANLSSLLAARVRWLTTYHSALAALPLVGKIAYSLLLLAHCYGEPQQEGTILLPLRFTQEELAALIGSSREAVNRVLSSFKRAGHIAVTDNGYFLIRDSHALQQYWPYGFDQ